MFGLPRSRYIQLPFGAFFHEQQSFSPALDYTVNSKLSRLVTLIGTVKLRAVNQPAAVMGPHFIVRRGALSRTFLDDLVLQTARQYLNTFLSLVRLKICLRFGKVLDSLF